MDDLIHLGEKYVMNTYRRQSKVFVKGEGSYLWDSEGNKYLDFVGGIAVNALGHSPKIIQDALKEQGSQLIHCSNLYWSKPQINLAKILVEASCADKVFFCNSGAEANEAAIKLARKWGKNRGKYEIISMENSFHGRTMGALTATGQEKYRRDFLPLPAGFKYVPFNDLQALEDMISPETCAIIIEPIQGEGGINVPTINYLKGVEDICHVNNLLLIVDEVQTGMGRTGKAFGYQNFGLEPDIITLAKGLGGGVPIGAMLAKEEVAKAFVPGDHASTFGGNPLVTSVALAVAEEIFKEDFLSSIVKKGLYFRERLEKLQKDLPIIKKVKGMGLMIGCTLDMEDASPISQYASDHHLLINVVGGNTLRFVPPLNTSKEEIDQAVEIISKALTHFKFL